MDMAPPATVEKHFDRIVRGIDERITHLLVIQKNQVCITSGFQAAQFLAIAEKSGVVLCGHFENLARAEVRCIEFQRREAMEEKANFHLLNHIVIIVDGLAVQSQAYQHSRPEHMKNR